MAYYSGKSILITGASSGIGEACAELLADQGAHLYLLARREKELQRVKNVCEARGAASVETYVCDVTDYARVDELVAQWTKEEVKFDGFINNAGISQRALTFDVDFEVERKLMEVNFFAPIYLNKVLYPLYNRDAHLVVISSLSGLFGFPQRSTYAASKHALKGYFESLQVEHYPFHVSIICPGRIKTQISVNAVLGDGSKHNEMDKAQEEGMPVEVCAQRILKAAQKRQKLVLIGRKELLLYYIKKFIPPLFYKIASNINANG